MYKSIIFLIALLFGLNLKAQVNTSDSTKTQPLSVVTKNDGTEYIGVVLSDDGRELLIDTKALGKIYLRKEDIKRIVRVESSENVVNGEYQSEGPFTTRYAFTNNALPIVKGQNYSMMNLYGPEVHFAVTNNLNIGIMTTWIASPLILALKYSFKTKNPKVNFSLGTLLGSTGYLNSFRGYGGLHWGSITLGSRKNNITFSGGYAYLQSGIIENGPTPGTYSVNLPNSPQARPLTHGPIASVATIWKVGARASFVFDSMFGVFSKQRTNSVAEELSPAVHTANPYSFTPPTYKYTVSHEGYIATTLLLMPGMRFQNSDLKAFQLCIAEVLVMTDKQTLSFPFPMCSWFRKF